MLSAAEAYKESCENFNKKGRAYYNSILPEIEFKITYAIENGHFECLYEVKNPTYLNIIKKELSDLGYFVFKMDNNKVINTDKITLKISWY